MKQTIRVVAGIIKQNNNILIAQRNRGEFKGLWEFPGGKIEANETAEEALLREMKEELSIDVIIEQFLMNVTYEYNSFYLDMDCFICSADLQNMHLNEHDQFAWISVNQDLDHIQWIPADTLILPNLKKLLSSNTSTKN